MIAELPFEAFPQVDAGTHGGCIVQLLATPDGRFLVSAGETTIRVWDLASPQDRSASRLTRLLLGRVNGPTDDGAIDGRTGRFAISRDGLWLVALKPWRHAFAGDPSAGHDAGRVTEVQVFALATGNLHARFVWPGQLLDLDFSPDGRWLATVGNVRSGRLRRAEVQVWAVRELLRPGARPAPRPQASLTLPRGQRAPTVPAALRFVPDAQAHPPRRGRAAGPASLVVALGDDALGRGELAWLRWTPSSGLTLERSTRSDGPIAPVTLAVSATAVVIGGAPPGGRKLRGTLFWFGHQDGSGTVNLEAPAASAAFSPTGHRLAVGLMGGMGGEQTVQVNVYDGSRPGALTLRSTYLGHDDTVQAVAFCGGDTVASAGGDNHAIHFWRPTQRIAETLDAIRGVGRVAIEPGITADERVLFGTVPMRLLPPSLPLRQQSFDLRRMQLSTTATSDLRQRDFASRKWWVGYENDMVIPLWFIGGDDAPADPTAFQPDLSLFVGSDDTWVIWTTSGYYNAGGGEGAARRIGYRINRALHQEGLIVPSDRFKAFYRPDIVQAVVRHGSESRALARGVDIPPVSVTHILPPIAELAPEGIRQQRGSVSLRFSIESPCPGYPVTRASLLRNGRVVWMHKTEAEVPAPALEYLQKTEAEAPAPALEYCEVPPLPLMPGRNRFAFHVENSQAKSVPVEFEIEAPAADSSQDDRASSAPGRLYLLSVGVAEFLDPSVAPLHCSDRDAQAVVDAFEHGQLAQRTARRQRGRNRAFEKVHTKLLVNDKATKQAILDELDSMCASIRQRHADSGKERDVLFVFLSGHGVQVVEKDGPNLFFSNHDIVMTADDVDRTGLSMLELGDRITSVPAEVVLVVDACHAALAGRSTMAGLDAEELARRVHAIYERGMYLVTAARAEEIAQEDAASNLGVLTAAMLQALDRAPAGTRSRATGGRGRLEVLMAEIVAGVQRFVPEVSARTGVPAQIPVCRIYGDLLPLTMLKT